VYTAADVASSLDGMEAVSVHGASAAAELEAAATELHGDSLGGVDILPTEGQSGNLEPGGSHGGALERGAEAGGVVRGRRSPEEMSHAELREQCRNASLPSSGTKAELIMRLAREQGKAGTSV
jgi:hypothetical protein